MKLKKLSLMMLLLSAFVFTACNDDDKKEIIVVNFNDKLTTADSTFSTDQGVEDTSNPYGSTFVYQFKDSQNAIEFNHFYSDWGYGASFSGGFTYTNTTDKTTLDFSNLSAITAKGTSGSVYLTSNTSEFSVARITNLKSDNFKFKGAWITNTTYAYLVIKEGNAFASKFNDGDWFILTATGYSADDKVIGKVDFYLADYRNGNTEAFDTWRWFDWSAIGNADYIKFTMSSSDTHPEYGMNTPAYFCMDAITLEEK